ncbi:MAG: 3-deoxy-7-phosphoheptulonate synthase, partial [Herbiconiux sp.]|nr:3-deoxy-7-phosphoheptulonate synthase [Herbiconiux sp.]
NYDSAALAEAIALLERGGVPARLVVDASHANSGKDHVRQASVVRELGAQLRAGDPIAGIMMESFLVAGAQKLDRPLDELVFGQSVTDACLGWETTVELIDELVGSAAAVGAPALEARK